MAEEKKETDLGFIERTFLMGVGAALYAKDRAEELADELVERGKLSREESGTFAHRLADEADKASESMQKTVTKETERVVAGMKLASSKDIDDVRDELTEIKALLASLRPVGTEPEK
jgi:polyhydroxyalkanoate synthesis regulator phasin